MNKIIKKITSITASILISLYSTTFLNVSMSNRITAKADNYESAWFPLTCIDVIQVCFENASHQGSYHIDCNSGTGSDGWVHAPFTGKVVAYTTNYSCALFQSINPVRYADGTIDYMTLCLEHGSNISQLQEYYNNGTVIKQGEAFYKAGGIGSGGKTQFSVHFDFGVCRGKQNKIEALTPYTKSVGYPYSGCGNMYPFEALFINRELTTKVGTNRGYGRNINGSLIGVPSGVAQYSDYDGLWKDLNEAIPDDWDTSTAGQYTTKGVNTNLNIRSSPNTSSSVVGKVPAGATVNVIKTRTDGSWAYIEYDGKNGYCSLEYLERTSPLSSGMSIEGKSEPTGRLEPGKFFAVKGMIYSNMPITRVWGGVYNRDWTPTKQWTEAFPGTTTYDLSKHFDNNIIFNNLDVGYYYYRIEATDDSGNVYRLCDSEFQIGDPPSIVWYSGLSPANLGDTFDGIILNTNCWKPIRSEASSNVVLHGEYGTTNEMWRFNRQSDGSYKIENFYDGLCLDAAGKGTTDGTNIGTYQSNDTEAQRWFIYATDDGYVFRPVYGELVMDLNGNLSDDNTNIHLWTYHGGEAQRFSIYTNSVVNYGTPKKGTLSATTSDNMATLTISNSIYSDSYELYRSINNKDFEKIADTTPGTYVDKNLKYGQTYYYKIKYSNRFYNDIESDTVSATTESKWFNELKPVDLGEQFDSTIIVKGKNYALISDEKENAVIYKQDGTTAEMWRFTRQSDGSYKIQNFANQKALDAYGSQTANGTNVTTHKSHSGENQKWFIYALNGGYVIRAAYTDKVLDVSDGLFQNSSNIQLYEKNDTASQVFELYDGKSTEYGKPQVDPITAYVRGTSVILTLNTPSYVDTVKIYRSYDKKNYEIIGETTEVTFKDEELDDNQKYYYKAEYINNFYAVESPVIYAITGNALIDGDVNGDNDFSIADIVVFQNWLLGRSDATLVNWKAADLCEDGRLNVFDLCLLRRKLIYG